MATISAIGSVVKAPGLAASRTFTGKSEFVTFTGLRAGVKLSQRRAPHPATHAGSRRQSRDAVRRLVVEANFSKVPEEPLGLYDPSMDSDACGVGFVAELSKKPNRKTVSRRSEAFCVDVSCSLNALGEGR